MTSILIVDDEPAVLSALQRALRRIFGELLQVTVCSDPLAALPQVRAKHFDIVLSDLRMPGLDGVSLLHLVSAVSPDSIRIVLTGTADFETAQRAINDAGVFRYLTKPWTDGDLKAHLESAIEACRRAKPAVRALTAEEAERARLEALEPGITSVEWGPNGEVVMPPLVNGELPGSELEGLRTESGRRSGDRAD